MSAVVVPAIMAFPSPIVGCLHGNSLESSWRWIFRPHAIGQVHCRGSQVVDHQHSASLLLPPRECLPFVHARMDRRRLNAELHRSLHWTRILWLSVDDFVCRCDFNITGESYR